MIYSHTIRDPCVVVLNDRLTKGLPTYNPSELLEKKKKKKEGEMGKPRLLEIVCLTTVRRWESERLK